ncbi:hypothetical protein TNCV_4121561 [Trichonephila clavipes]|nr:hypothetical protein TNCV_4121561 [Trichonephila clavipes]
MLILKENSIWVPSVPYASPLSTTPNRSSSRDPEEIKRDADTMCFRFLTDLGRQRICRTGLSLCAQTVPPPLTWEVERGQFYDLVRFLCQVDAFRAAGNASKERKGPAKAVMTPGNEERVRVSFQIGIFDVKDAPRTGRSVVENVDEITEIVQVDRHVNNRSITQELKIDHKKQF